MSVEVVVGAQWGDEGKGKIVDLLAASADWVARCQGGPNAGHTVVVGDQTIILHLIPSGILRPESRCVIGNGVVIDIEGLVGEMDMLIGHGFTVDDRLTIDARAHLILPIHKALERREEAARGAARIGTTGRGIGPAYESKVGRRGVRMVDLLDDERLRTALDALRRHVEPQLDDVDDIDDLVDHTRALADRVRGLIGDVPGLLHEAIGRDERILVECAQGTDLDIDHGTYPYVTSSTTTASGACTGLGIGPRAIDNVLGVTKAYATRVGEGPFPSELDDDESAVLRNAGAEFGATTGRPRRCGWLDLVALRRAVRINSIDRLAMTKLDVLDGRQYAKVVVDYEVDARAPWYPQAVLETARPVLHTLPGWQEPTASARSSDELPPPAQAYIDFVADQVGVPVTIVSVGSDRDATVMIDPPKPAGVLY